jgi:hypothetical protein
MAKAIPAAIPGALSHRACQGAPKRCTCSPRSSLSQIVHAAAPRSRLLISSRMRSRNES